MTVDLEALKQRPETLRPPERVVSLVPSMTESLFALSFGSSVVGVTEYCLYPKRELADLPRVGGPKDADVERIIELRPDLVFANQEENTPAVIEKLAAAGIPVWVSFPQTVDDAIEVLRQLLAIYHTDQPAMAINSLQVALDYAVEASIEMPKVRYFCPIWQQTASEDTWWMTFNAHTYIDNLLSVLGGENIFKNRERRYPLDADLGKGDAENSHGRDTRYPRISQEEVIEAEPEMILLPSEPFDFDIGHIEMVRTLLAFTPAARNGKIKLVDGSLLTWHGTRLGKALTELPGLFY